MTELILKITFDDTDGYKGHGDNTSELIKMGIEETMQYSLEDDSVIKEGWTVEIVEEQPTLNKVKLTIGDWSQDGHNQYDIFVYNVNKNVSEIRQAYKDSCKLTGLQFNNNENYTGLSAHDTYDTPYHICTEHESFKPSELAIDILSNFGIDYSEDRSFPQLIMQFIKLSLKDLTWEEATYKKSELENIQPINGWCNKELNVGFGYGLYY